jgi:hypothetical protein
MRERKRQSGLRTAGSIVLPVALLFCVWLTGGAVAYGWLSHADHYGADFALFAKSYYTAGGLMTLGVLLYYLRQDLPALILDVLAYVPMLVILIQAIRRAEENGWSGQTEATFGLTAAQAWRNGMMWTVIPFLLLAVLAITRFLSQDEKERRQARRDAKEQAANQPAPSLLGGMTDGSLRQPAPETETNRRNPAKKRKQKKK